MSLLYAQAPETGFASGTSVSFELLPLEQARNEWCGLIDMNPSARLFHRERWLEILTRAYGLELHVALLRQRLGVAAGCVLARSKIPFASRFVALPFSDLCPPLSDCEEADFALLKAIAADHRVRACEIRGAVAPAPWRTVEWYLNWELDISRPTAKIHQGLATNFSRNIVKARKAGLKVECGDDTDCFKRFCVLHFNSRRRLGLPSQPARFFRAVREVFADCNDVTVWLASRAGQDLAAILVLREEERIYFKWSARSGGNSMSAAHLLTWAIVEEHAGKARVFDLGRTDGSNDGLNRFKRELGAISRPLPYSFLPFVPRHGNPESLTGSLGIAARIWRRLPPALCRAIGSAVYRYLS